MEYLSEDEVMTIRRRLAVTEMAGRDFGNVDPVDVNAFSSAVARQRAGYGRHQKYRSVPEIAATLFYGLNLNHSFDNGNKRTSLVTLLAFLQRNKFSLVGVTEDELYLLATQVADHTFPLVKSDSRNPDTEVTAIAEWIKGHARNLILGDHMMRYKQLKRQLEDLGCWFGKPKDNFIKIFRDTTDGELCVTIGYQRSDFEAPIGQVKKIRRTLKLSEVDGVDSAAFYDLEQTVDSFVNRYRQLLDRLAET